MIIKSNKGFSFIDLIVAIMLMVFSAMIFATVIPGSIRASGQARDYKIAANISQRKIEQLRAMKYESLTSAILTSSGVVDSASNNGIYQFTTVDGVANQLSQGTGQLEITNPSSTVKEIVIKINWTGANDNKDREVKLITRFTDKRIKTTSL